LAVTVIDYGSIKKLFQRDDDKETRLGRLDEGRKT
jgi:hypothetical protein